MVTVHRTESGGSIFPDIPLGSMFGEDYVRGVLGTVETTMAAIEADAQENQKTETALFLDKLGADLENGILPPRLPKRHPVCNIPFEFASQYEEIARLTEAMEAKIAAEIIAKQDEDQHLQAILNNLKKGRYTVSTAFAKEILRRYPNNLPGAVLAIKESIVTRELAVLNSGRIPMPQEWMIDTLDPNPLKSKRYRDESLAAIEQMDADLKGLAEKGWNSPLALDILISQFSYIHDNNEVVFHFMLQENKVREMRASEYVRLKQDNSEDALRDEELEIHLYQFEADFRSKEGLIGCIHDAACTDAPCQARCLRAKTFKDHKTLNILDCFAFNANHARQQADRYRVILERHATIIKGDDFLTKILPSMKANLKAHSVNAETIVKQIGEKIVAAAAQAEYPTLDGAEEVGDSAPAAPTKKKKNRKSKKEKGKAIAADDDDNDDNAVSDPFGGNLALINGKSSSSTLPVNNDTSFSSADSIKLHEPKNYYSTANLAADAALLNDPYGGTNVTVQLGATPEQLGYYTGNSFSTDYRTPANTTISDFIANAQDHMTGRFANVGLGGEFKSVLDSLPQHPDVLDETGLRSFIDLNSTADRFKAMTKKNNELVQIHLLQKENAELKKKKNASFKGPMKYSPINGHSLMAPEYNPEKDEINRLRKKNAELKDENRRAMGSQMYNQMAGEQSYTGSKYEAYHGEEDWDFKPSDAMKKRFDAIVHEDNMGFIEDEMKEMGQEDLEQVINMCKDKKKKEGWGDMTDKSYGELEAKMAHNASLKKKKGRK